MVYLHQVPAADPPVGQSSGSGTHSLRPMPSSLPKILLHLEGLAALAFCVAVYHHLGASWILFAVLFLAPDLFMLGYLAGPVTGARIYNVAHTYVIPLAVAALGHLLRQPLLAAIGVIWAAHVGFDRFLGYGLKYGTAFQDTHLSRV